MKLIRRSANPLSVFNYELRSRFRGHVTDVLQLNCDRHYSQYSTQQPESISALLDTLSRSPRKLFRIVARPVSVNVELSYFIALAFF